MLEGRPHIVDLMKNGKVQLVFNTTDGAGALTDSYTLRRTALMNKIAYYTTVAGAKASVEGIAALKAGPWMWPRCNPTSKARSSPSTRQGRITNVGRNGPAGWALTPLVLRRTINPWKKCQ